MQSEDIQDHLKIGYRSNDLFNIDNTCRFLVLVAFLLFWIGLTIFALKKSQIDGEVLKVEWVKIDEQKK